MYRWTVLLDADTELEQLAAEALRTQRGLFLAISRMSAARAVAGRPDGRERRRRNARKPARCQRRMVAGWTSNVASRHAGTMRAASPIAKRCHGAQRDPPRELPLRHDELLPKQRVLGDETGAAAHDVGGQPHHEPKDVDHAARRTAAGVRMTFVARTGTMRRVRRRSGGDPVGGLGGADRIRGTGRG